MIGNTSHERQLTIRTSGVLSKKIHLFRMINRLTLIITELEQSKYFILNIICVQA